MSSEIASGETPNKNVNEFNRFLDNNIEFLNKKYLEYYGSAFPLSKLSQPSCIQKTLQFIYHIFSFNKYQKDEKLNNTLRKSLTSNIFDFIAKETKIMSRNPKTPYENGTAIKLLKYCIENNDMFAVHYDKQNTLKKLEESGNETFEHLRKTVSAQAKEQTKNPQEKQQAKKSILDEEKVQKKIKQSAVKQSVAKQAAINQSTVKYQVNQKQNEIGNEKIEAEMEIQNEFQLQEPKKKQNMQLIRKQLKSVFEFYCKQQQNVGPNFTFDSINQKCKMMNLGKFVAFANASNLAYVKNRAYSESKIDKKFLIETYKKIAQNRKEIDFEIFLKIILELKKFDEKIYEILGLGDEGNKGQAKITERLKYFSLPFNTRDPHGRQNFPHGRLFIPKLTSHSGKVEEALREELISRREKIKFVEQKHMLSIGRSRGFSSGAELKTQKNYQTKLMDRIRGNKQQNIIDKERQDLKFLSRLITHDENDESDEIFLKDYKIPLKNFLNNSKERKLANPMEQQSRYKNQQLYLNSQNQFVKNSKAFKSRLIQRKGAIIPEIRRRIKDLQSSQQRISTQLQRKVTRNFQKY